VARAIDPDDLIDSVTVAELLGLASRSSVSVYQKRYEDMPRPVVDLGQGRSRLWSRRAVLTWANATGRVRIK
jgi:glutathione-regulated potassium-efflux system ancillary protein KefG